MWPIYRSIDLSSTAALPRYLSILGVYLPSSDQCQDAYQSCLEAVEYQIAQLAHNQRQAERRTDCVDGKLRSGCSTGFPCYYSLMIDPNEHLDTHMHQVGEVQQLTILLEIKMLFTVPPLAGPVKTIHSTLQIISLSVALLICLI